ncbi:MAG: hypothetical protein OXI35_19170, partial [Gemmatimonadota bacterium]|nr:hypothetical protein [Gemmatimonadota bacterium]
KQVEEAQQQHAEIDQQHAEVNPAAPVVAEEEKEKEEEPTFGWPFDGDPFEEPVVAEVDPAEAEREALEAERQALEAERRAMVAEQQAMERLTETKSEDAYENEKQRPRRTRSHWFLTPQTARDAIVYMEILGKPKSEREEW